MRRATFFALVLVLATGIPAAAQVPVSRATAEGPAEGPGRISGLVADPEGRPLATVAVTLRVAADSSMVTGTMTGADGRFRIEDLPLDEYILHVGVLGFLSRTSEVLGLTEERTAIDLGTIGLDPAPVEVEGVEAVVDRPAMVVEADRTIYDARAMPVASAGTAVDVLRAVPELEVDVNSNVRLRGNRSVAVHLNGRPTPLRGEQLSTFLEQLPGDRIERIEVMPNPSARHDPEGMGGIVNIVLREDVELGLSGSVGVTASTRNQQGLRGRFNVQRGRLTLFSGAGVNVFRQETTMYDFRRNLVTQPVTAIEQSSSAANRGNGWNLDWTAEVKVGEQATLWSNAWVYKSGSGSDGITAYGIFEEPETVRERYDRHDDADFNMGSANFGLGFKKAFEPQKEELTVDARYSTGANDRVTTQMRFFEILAGAPADGPPELTLNDVDASNGNLSIQADYFRPVGEARLDLGYRAWRRDQGNDNLLRIFLVPGDAEPDTRVHAGYDYREVFHSFYGTFGRTHGRFGYQAGLRAELSSTDFTPLTEAPAFDRSYRTLFPSMNVSFTPRQGRTLRLLYSKRISRPAPFYLDPYIPSTDPLNVSVGNPDLRPSYTESFTLDFSHAGRVGTVRVAPYFRSTTDMWERIRTVDTEGVATSRWENAASARAYGSTFTVSLRSAGRLSGSSTFSLYRDVRDGTNLSTDYHRSATMWSMGGNVGVRLREGLTAQVFANHFPPQSILQGRASGYTFTSLALRHQFWEQKGTLSLNVSDPLNMNRYTSSSSDATYVQNSRSSFSSRLVMLGLTVNFGQTPQRQSRPTTGPEQPQGETIRVP